MTEEREDWGYDEVGNDEVDTVGREVIIQCIYGVREDRHKGT